jgi:hypothetical protein
MRFVQQYGNNSNIYDLRKSNPASRKQNAPRKFRAPSVVCSAREEREEKSYSQHPLQALRFHSMIFKQQFVAVQSMVAQSKR